MEDIDEGRRNAADMVFNARWGLFCFLVKVQKRGLK